MPRFTSFKPDVFWKRLTTTGADWKSEDADMLVRILEQLLIIRRFEEKLLELKRKDLVYGPVHTSIGQDGAAVGAMTRCTVARRFGTTGLLGYPGQ